MGELNAVNNTSDCKIQVIAAQFWNISFKRPASAFKFLSADSIRRIKLIDMQMVSRHKIAVSFSTKQPHAPMFFGRKRHTTKGKFKPSKGKNMTI